MDGISLLVFATAFVVWMATSARPADDRQIEAMAEMYRVPINDAVVERLRHRVLILRRWRCLGACAGVGVIALVAAFVPAVLAINSLLFGIAIGYGVSAVLGELWLVRRRRRGEIASPRQRDLRSVIGWWAVAPAALAAALTGGAIVATVLWRPGVDTGTGTRPLSDLAVSVIALAFVTVVTGSVLVVRLVVRAPERGSVIEDHVVQRASRLVAIMTVIGATWMTVGVLGTLIWQPIWDGRTSNGGLSFLLVIGGLYLSLSVLMGFISTVSTLPRNRPFVMWWRRRSSPQPSSMTGFST